MKLTESIAIKAAGAQPTSSIASKVQKIRNNNQRQLTPGKPTGAAGVDKSNSQF